MRTSLALACILAVAGVAAAEPVVHLEAVNDGTPAGYSGMTRYLVYLVAEDGYFAGGLDGKFEGPMHQVGMDLVVVSYDTPHLEWASLLGADEGADTHLMVNPKADPTDPVKGMEAPGFEATEDNPNSPGAGVGSILGGPGGGIFSVAWTQVLTSNLHVAQVVVPDGEVVTFDGAGAYKWEVSPGVYDYDQNPVSLTIPEPATLGLLAVGVVGALIRRRR